MTRRKQPKERRKRGATRRKEIRIEELEAIVERAKQLGLSEEEHGTLKGAVDTLAFLTHELEAKDVSIARLRKLLFGASTEKSSAVLGKPPAASEESTAEGPAQQSTSGDAPAKKVKGHGRTGAAAYRGAKHVAVTHASLNPGDTCPGCSRGKVYPMKQPAVLVRITGMAPLAATVYELARLRCNLCGEVFTAREPPEAGPAKYDEGAASMVALLKYGTGMPFNRIERLQKGMGIPLPSSTQWELVAEAAEVLLPAYQELVRLAAQGEVLHNDDTTMQILDLTGKRRSAAIAAGDIDPDQRVGIFTTGIVSKNGGIEIALFFTGDQHAGTNLAHVLAHRAPDLARPIQMSDALSHNTCGDFDAIMSSCLVHARRQFVEVAANFPDECHRVIDALREVYRTDAHARNAQLSPEARLQLHAETSGPLLRELKAWLDEQVKEHHVEPNSGLGKAIAYMRKHWEKLTLFLHEPGAPLDNNICERALKKSILHRKNAYFFRSRRGARVGDLFMSLIHTAERCDASPFEYLVALQRNAKIVAQSPGEWMPWNYAETLTALGHPAGN